MGVFGGLAPPRLPEGERRGPEGETLCVPLPGRTPADDQQADMALCLADSSCRRGTYCSVLYRQAREALSRRGGQQTLGLRHWHGSRLPAVEPPPHTPSKLDGLLSSWRARRKAVLSVGASNCLEAAVDAQATRVAVLACSTCRGRSLPSRPGRAAPWGWRPGTGTRSRPAAARRLLGVCGLGPGVGGLLWEALWRSCELWPAAAGLAPETLELACAARLLSTGKCHRAREASDIRPGAPERAR